MKIDRAQLLKTLTISAAGLTKREILEQSNAFIFTKDKLITFNGEVLTTTKNPLDFEGAVPAEDLLKLLSKFPDSKVDVFAKGSELIVKGKRRSAGLTKDAEIHLPYQDVPTPKKWREVPETLMAILHQAAQACGRDETQPMTTAVHVTPDCIEACDNFRAYRHIMKTGFKKDILIPSISLYMLDYTREFSLSAIAHSWTMGRGTDREPNETHHISHYGYSKGWVHFKVKTGHYLSVCTMQGEGFPNLDSLIKMKKPQKVELPKQILQMLSRSKVIHTSEGYEATVEITISKGRLTLKTSKESGWYKEHEDIAYKGPSLQFQVHPVIFEDLLKKQRNVFIQNGKMKIQTDDSVFVISLTVDEEGDA